MSSPIRGIVGRLVAGIRFGSSEASQRSYIEPLVSRLLFSREGSVTNYVRVSQDEHGFFVEQHVHHPLTDSTKRSYYDSLESADRAAQQAFEVLKKPLGPAPSIDD